MNAAPVTWADAMSAIGSVTTPLVVVVLGLIYARRHSRSEELLRARIEYYKALAPDLNVLMCYMTFIGSWRDHSPVEIVALKRRLDQTFYCAAPLFSDPVRDAYVDFERFCFSTFNHWGEDALIRSGAYRRRQAWQREPGWALSWDAMFSKPDSDAIPASDLSGIRKAHDALIAALVRDLDLTRARSGYTTSLVSLNAHAPKQHDIEGWSP
ncbi:hypothetical protein ACVW00_001014 [Marmoricola sp. URHA0025 HA25]